MKINANYANLEESYLFSTIAILFFIFYSNTTINDNLILV